MNFKQKSSRDIHIGPKRCVEISPTVIEAIILVDTFFKGDHEKTTAWMNYKNNLLGGISPTHMINVGRGEKLITIIKDLLNGNIA